MVAAWALGAPEDWTVVVTPAVGAPDSSTLGDAGVAAIDVVAECTAPVDGSALAARIRARRGIEGTVSITRADGLGGDAALPTLSQSIRQVLVAARPAPTSAAALTPRTPGDSADLAAVAARVGDWWAKVQQALAAWPDGSPDEQAAAMRSLAELGLAGAGFDTPAVVGASLAQRWATVTLPAADAPADPEAADRWLNALRDGVGAAVGGWFLGAPLWADAAGGWSSLGGEEPTGDPVDQDDVEDWLGGHRDVRPGVTALLDVVQASGSVGGGVPKWLVRQHRLASDGDAAGRLGGPGPSRSALGHAPGRHADRSGRGAVAGAPGGRSVGRNRACRGARGQGGARAGGGPRVPFRPAGCPGAAGGAVGGATGPGPRLVSGGCARGGRRDAVVDQGARTGLRRFAGTTLGFGMTTHYIPVTRTAGVEDGLSARLADPLWMLARQWQLGEFRGDDAGSAVSVTFAGAAHHPTWWRPEGGADPASWQQWTVNDTPLETVIEAEPETDTARFRLRIDGGARARRMLVAAGLNAMAAKLIAAGPVARRHAGPSSGAADALSVTAVADGEALAALAETWTTAAALPAELGGTAAQQTAFVDVMGAWLAWWQPRVAALGVDAAPPTADPPAWDRHRLEHRGTLAFAGAPTVRLHLDQYPGGGVDWHCADAVTGAPEDLPATALPEPFASPQPLQEISVPLPTSFAGMAAPRFWEFEDAEVDYGSIDASPADLARLLLVQFSTVYGNDWFSLPVRLPVGALVRVDAVRVTDSFGGVHELNPFARTSAGWRMYALRAPEDRPELGLDYYWCAPTLAARLVSPAVETVTIRRDEMANTAWAVVQEARDSFGRTFHGARRQAGDAGGDGSAAVPRRNTGGGKLVSPRPGAGGHRLDRLVLRALVRRAHGEVVEAHPPGAILAGGADWWIHEEELGRAGLTLDRRVKVGRWHDGSRHRWIGRNVWPGTGEASSGLLWDTVVE